MKRSLSVVMALGCLLITGNFAGWRWVVILLGLTGMALIARNMFRTVLALNALRLEAMKEEIKKGRQQQIKKISKPRPYVSFYTKIIPDHVSRQCLFLVLMGMLAFSLYMAWAHWTGIVR